MMLFTITLIGSSWILEVRLLANVNEQHLVP